MAVTAARTAAEVGERTGAAWRRLRQTGSRRTLARALVVDALARAEAHLSVAGIHGRIARDHPEVNVSTVHRTVAFLVEHEVAHVLPWPGEARYGLTDEPHHHAVCDHCGAVREIPAATLSGAVAAAESSCDFRLGEAGLALFGRCPQCAAGAPAHGDGTGPA